MLTVTITHVNDDGTIWVEDVQVPDAVAPAVIQQNTTQPTEQPGGANVVAPPPVSDDIANELANRPPDANTSHANIPQDIIDINRRIAAGERLTQAEEQAAKVWLEGSYGFYKRLQSEREEKRQTEQRNNDTSESNTLYFETKEDWDEAGRPGGTENTRVLIGEKPPKGKEYERPDKTKLVIGQETDIPETIERTPELEALRRENPRLYNVLVKEGFENYLRAVNAENFVSKQEVKRQERLAKQAEKVIDKYLDASDEERFRMLQDDPNNAIPKGAKLTSYDPATRTFTYSYEVKGKEKFDDFDPNVRMDRIQYRHNPKTGALEPIIAPLWRNPETGKMEVKPPPKTSESINKGKAAGLGLAAGLAIVEPTPIGELILLAAAGITASSATSSIKKFLLQQRENKGTTSPTQSPRLPMETFPIGQTIGSYIETLPAKLPFEVPSTTAGKSKTFKTEIETIPISRRTAPSVYIAQAAVADAEADILTEIRPHFKTRTVEELLGGDNSSIGKKLAGLAALDDAVVDAVQSGELDSKGAVAYQNARNSYLQRIAQYESSVINYASNQFRNSGLSKAELATLASITLASMRINTNQSQKEFERQFARKMQQRIKQQAQREGQATRTDINVRTQTRVGESTQTREATKTQTATQTATGTSTATHTGEKTTTNEQARENELTRTAERTNTRTMAKRIPPPLKALTDDEKRDIVKGAGGAIAWPQGELNDKKVWHIIKAPYRPSDHLVVTGQAPEGAKLYLGAREAYKSVTLLSGAGPGQPAKFEGGAVDPVVFTSNGKVRIAFSHDKETKKRYSKKFSKRRPVRTVPTQLADDVVLTGNRQHIKVS